MNFYFFFLLLGLSTLHFIYIICKKQIIWARTTRSTGNCSWLHFQTRLPIVCLCTPLWALIILQLWSWTYTHFQILKAQEISTLVPKKGSIFFFCMTLSFTISILHAICYFFRSSMKGSWPAMSKRWNHIDIDSSIWNTHRHTTGRILSNSIVCFYSFKNKMKSLTSIG